MILTISIPTYNRPDKVKNTVSKLIPQLNSDVNILILDNCSEVNVKDHLTKNVPGFADHENIKVIRNITNVGPDANFVKCFENSQAPFTWTLGDDDEVYDNAVQVILNEIEKYKDYQLAGFNFNCNLVDRTQTILISSIDELGEKLDFFGNWVFISTNVYDTQEYLKHIRYATYTAYSMASQVVPPMIAISQNKTFILSKEYIVRNQPLEDVNERWSDIKLNMVLTSILETPVGFGDNFLKFGKKLGELFIGMGAPMFSIIKSVDGNLSLIDSYHLYLYDQIYYRTYYFRKSRLKAMVAFHSCKLLLRNKLLMRIAMTLFKSTFDRRINGITKFKLFIRK